MRETKFKKITACLDMAGCPNRCKHCWLGHFDNGSMATDDLKYMASCFRKYTDRLEIYSWFREPDYKNNYKELWILDNELSKNSAPKRFELLSFWRINRDDEYIKWAYELGVRKCQLTFFGLEEKTDYFVGRKGAFRELLSATEKLLEHGIAPRWQVFVNKKNINELQALIELSKDMLLSEKCKNIGQEFKLFVHQGSCDGENEKLYDIRITDEDIIHIPKEFQHCLGETENKLYNELIQDNSTENLVSNSPVFYVTKDFDVYPNYSQISSWWFLGNIKRDNIEKVINNYINNTSLAQNSRLTVPICEMVKVCGNPNSNRLFDKGDYITYILNQYCKRSK